MKITGSSSEIVKYLKDSTVSPSQGTPDETGAAQEGRSSKSDKSATVSFSEKSKDLQKAMEIINATPDVRTEKVDALRSKIAAGAYKVNYEETADKLMASFFGDAEPR